MIDRSLCMHLVHTLGGILAQLWYVASRRNTMWESCACGKSHVHATDPASSRPGPQPRQISSWLRVSVGTAQQLRSRLTLLFMHFCDPLIVQRV